MRAHPPYKPFLQDTPSRVIFRHDARFFHEWCYHTRCVNIVMREWKCARQKPFGLSAWTKSASQDCLFLHPDEISETRRDLNITLGRKSMALWERNSLTHRPYIAGKGLLTICPIMQRRVSISCTKWLSVILVLCKSCLWCSIEQDSTCKSLIIIPLLWSFIMLFV